MSPSDETFKPGDVVEFKSGSIPMTVTSAERDYVWVTWFTKDGPQKDHFVAAVLQPVSDESHQIMDADF